MLNIEKLFTRKNIPQLILAIVGILYILGDIRPPHEMAGLVTTPIGVFVLLVNRN